MLLIIVLSVCASACMPTMATAKSGSPRQREITHLFTHALIADPQKAFAEDNWMRSSYDADCLTVKEFKAILQSLYAKNYMLVDVGRIASQGKKLPLDFPENKKPLVLSFDDINYYSKKMNLGMNDKLVLHNGKIATLLNGKVQTDNETVTVLENFIAAHPDFSYQGARGILCLTGFDGVLGYRTQPASATSAAEKEAVKPVIAELKRLGWKFACHSYGHYHMKSITDKKFISDTKKWINEVEPLVGKTEIYVYPYGEHEILDGDLAVTAKQRYLSEHGFSLFCGVGVRRFFDYMPNTEHTVLMMDRSPLDGTSLRYYKKTYSQYFDFDAVYDAAVRP